MAVRQNKSAFGTDTGTESTHGTLPNNPGSYSGAIVAGDLNQNISRQADDASTFLIRFLIQCDGGSSAANAAPQFEYNKNSAGWVSITTASANIKAVNPNAFVNAAATTLRMGGSGGTDATNQGCTTDGLSGGPQMDIPANGQMETICGVQLVPTDLSVGDTLDLRISGPITVYDFTPRITITAGAVNFTGEPSPGSATVTGLAPTPSAGATTEPTPASATITGLAPTWEAIYPDWTGEPTTAALTLTGLEPTVATTEDIAVEPSTAALAVTGLAPVVNVGLTETLTANAVLTSTNLQDSALTSPPVLLTDLDEDPDAGDSLWWTAIDPNADIAVRLGFPTSSGNLVGTQTVNVLIRGSSLPSRDWKLELYESGVKKTSETTAAVTSISGEVVTLTFPASELTDQTGAGVEIRISATAA